MKTTPSVNNSSAPYPTIVQIVGYYPPHLGGMEVVAQETSLALAEAGWPVEVLSSDVGAESSPRQERSRNYRLRRLRTFEFAHTPFMPTLWWRLWRVKQPAIFHLHLSQAFLPETVWLVAKLRQIPYVIHFHLDTDPSGRLGFLFVLYKRFVQPGIMRGAAHVITLSPEQADMVQQRYRLSSDKVSYLPNGVSQKYLDLGSKTQNKKISAPLRLLFVGRLSAQKRVDRLIKALSLTKADVQLNIVGDGEDRAKLEKLVKQRDLKNITFHGLKEGQELLDTYQQADVFVLPSDKEGMPLVLLEAMAAGLPVIGSDVQGIREHLAGSGVLVPRPLPSTFAKAIDDFYSHRDERFSTLSQAGQDKAADYSWPKLATRLQKLYRSLPLATPRRQLSKRGLLAALVAWWLVFLGLRTFHGAPAILTNAIGFSFLILVPGMLSVLGLRLKSLPAWGKFVLAIGLSILELIVAVTIGNTYLQWGAAKRPLDPPFLIAEVSLLLMTLLVFAWRHMEADWEFNLRSKLRELLPTRLDRLLSGLPLIFVLLSVLGATSLNNGGSSIWTMIMLIGMAVFSLILVYRSNKLSDTTILNALFLMSLSLLLMTSLRGWYTTGNDIQLEYWVFQLAKTNGVWQIQRFRDPYNACLSITILPTIFANLLKIFNPYVYKIFFQIIFSICPPIIYLLVRKWLSPALAILATLYFISFPTFFTDMPFLNRQEIAFVFVALMFYIIFQVQINLRLRRVLFLVLGLGLILSHYSTTYSIIAILLLAAVTWPLLRRTGHWLKTQRIFAKSSIMAVQQPAKDIKKITLWMVIMLICVSFLWTTVLTNTGSNTVLVVRETFAAIGNSFNTDVPKSDTTNYSLFSFHTESPTQELSNYVKNVVVVTRAKDPSAYYPVASYTRYPIKVAADQIQPLTSLGQAFAKIGLNVATFNFDFRQASAKLLQILVISGFIYILMRRRYTRLLDGDFVSLSIASIIFVVLQVILPVLSVQYGLLRAFQQSLMFLGLFTVLGSIALFAWLPTRLLKLGAPVLLAVLFFLSSSGVITQALGGYYAQLNLNNSGTYYDIYYTHAQEIAGIHWLNNATSQATNTGSVPVEVQADQFVFSKLAIYTNLSLADDIYPGLIQKDTYVLLGYSNVHNNQATITYNGDLVTYTYPTQFLNQQKNLIYSNGGVDIYR